MKDFKERLAKELRKDFRDVIQTIQGEYGDVFSYWRQSIVPELEGHEDLKDCLLTYLVNYRDMKPNIRDRIHILLVGEAGTGKSLVMQWMETVFGAKYLTGEDLRASSLKGDARRKDLGVRILQQVDEYHGGMLCIDEFELFPDKDSLRSAMESGRVIIAKAGKEIELPTQVKIIAGANELRGVSEAIKSRFDFVFQFEKPTPQESKKIAQKIARLRAGLIDYDVSILKDFIEVAQGFKPQITKEEVERIDKVFDRYFDIRQIGREGRWIDSVFRIAIAIARIHFEDLKAEHIVRALQMKDRNLKKLEVEELLEVI